MSSVRTIESEQWIEIEPGYHAEVSATPNGKWGAIVGAVGPLGYFSTPEGSSGWRGQGGHVRVAARFSTPDAAVKAARKQWTKVG